MEHNLKSERPEWNPSFSFNVINTKKFEIEGTIDISMWTIILIGFYKDIYMNEKSILISILCISFEFIYKKPYKTYIITYSKGSINCRHFTAIYGINEVSAKKKYLTANPTHIILNIESLDG